MSKRSINKLQIGLAGEPFPPEIKKIIDKRQAIKARYSIKKNWRERIAG